MMNIIRAWKDKEYRMSLSDEELSLLPDNPAGPMELSDDLLDIIIGGDGGHNDHGSNDSNDDSNNGGSNGILACSGALCSVNVVGGKCNF
jgi:mersacidin/lichenicidin family type 2 lantibiotic